MCDFVSWVEKGRGKTKKYLYLNNALIKSERGKELLKGLPQDDLIGHGAICLFYGLEQDEGKNKECLDFSSPNNFPEVIAKAIKNGEFRGLGTPAGLLTATALKAYQEAIAPAEKAYQEAKAPAWKAYEKATATAWKAYQEATATALKAYQEAKATFWDLFAIQENKNPVWRD